MDEAHAAGLHCGVLSHLLSGGVIMRSFVPAGMIPVLQGLERGMRPAMKYLGVFGTIESASAGPPSRVLSRPAPIEDAIASRPGDSHQPERCREVPPAMARLLELVANLKGAGRFDNPAGGDDGMVVECIPLR